MSRRPTRALSILKRYYTPRFTEHDQYRPSSSSMAAPPHNAAIAAVNIARLTDTPSMLPFALYLVSNLGGRMMDGYHRRDGSVEHLATADVRRCIDARTELARKAGRLMQAVFTLEPSAGSGCTTVEKCKSALAGIREEAGSNTPGECGGLNPLNKVIETWAEDYELLGVVREGDARAGGGGAEEGLDVFAGYVRIDGRACGFTPGDEPSQS